MERQKCSHHSFLHHMLSTCCRLTLKVSRCRAQQKRPESVYQKNSPLSEGSSLKQQQQPVAKETKKKKEKRGWGSMCGEAFKWGIIRWLEWSTCDTFQGKQNSLAGRSAWGSKTSWEEQSKETPNKWRWGFGRSLLCRICWVLPASSPQDLGFLVNAVCIFKVFPNSCKNQSHIKYHYLFVLSWW